MNLSLFALAVAAFGIGTTEFVIMGLLPDVARDLAVSISSAGLLITGYALGVAIGAPIMALLTARWPRKRALLLLMALFVAGNALCALSANYWLLMGARIITALCHGAFFGIGAVTAASLVPENRKASAVAMMFTGLTLANVLGVPLGTALGQAAGWRTTFWVVSAVGVIAFVSLLRFLPADRPTAPTNVRSELKSLANGRVWTALLLTVLFSASMFTLFTYIAPILGEITGVSPRGVTWTLLLIGVGLTLGNVVGGKLADWRLGASLTGMAAVIAALQALFYWTSGALIPAEITLVVWGAASFAACAALQLNAMRVGSRAPSLISTLNIGAFNAGNALGAWLGSAVIASGLGLRPVTLAAAGMAVLALLLTAWSFRNGSRGEAGALPAV
jgi:DHA1 family inner membrane transport protein